MTSDPSLSKIQSLNLLQLPGKIPTYYIPDHADRAREIQAMLEDALVFFADQLEVNADLSFALLGPVEWASVTEIPYGLPWVSYAPHITVFPATLDHPMGKLIIQNASTSSDLLKHNRSNEQIADDFVALIGFHELGHIITWQYGINPPTAWISEILASFFAYAFMKAKYPHQATLWQTVCELFTQVISPQHTTLTDFETLYAGVGIENYIWYQGVFQRRVDAVFQAQGLDFLRLVKQALAENGDSKDSDPLFLAMMEQISPGTQTWVHQNKLL